MKKLSMIIAIACMMISPMMQLEAQVIAEDDIVGIWVDDQTKDTLEIYVASDKSFSGKILELKIPNDSDGVPRKDVNNPKPRLKNLPLKGLEFLTGLKFDRDEWDSGRYYNYEDEKGEISDCKVKLLKKNNIERLEVYTYPASGDRTTYWTRHD